MSKSHSKLMVKFQKQTEASIESHKHTPLPFQTSTTGSQGSPILERDSGTPCGKDIDLMGQYHWPNSKNNGFLGDQPRERTLKEGRDESTSHRSDYNKECNIEDLSTTTKGKLNKLINEEDALAQNGVIAQQYSNTNPNLSLQSYTIYNVEAALNRDMTCKSSAGAGSVCAMNQEDLKRERRKLSNRESAKRSRLRRMQQRERLEAEIEEKKDEHYRLTKQLRHKSMECCKVSNENQLLEEELVRLYGPAALDGIVNPENEPNPNGRAEMVTGKENNTPET